MLFVSRFLAEAAFFFGFKEVTLNFLPLFFLLQNISPLLTNRNPRRIYWAVGYGCYFHNLNRDVSSKSLSRRVYHMKNFGLCLPNGERTAIGAGDCIVYSPKALFLTVYRSANDHDGRDLLIGGERKVDASWITTTEQFENMAIFISELFGLLPKFSNGNGGSRICKLVLPP